MAYQERVDAATQKAANAANDAASNVADSASKAAEKIQTGADSVRREVVNRAADLGDQLSDTVKRLGVDTSEIKASMDDAWDALEGRFRELVRRRPVRAVVVAAAVGVLLGFVSRG
jgi:ElaB/YqjD/DUF883 family membrane-anchored ribosome-binding protein